MSSMAVCKLLTEPVSASWSFLNIRRNNTWIKKYDVSFFNKLFHAIVGVKIFSFDVVKCQTSVFNAKQKQLSR